MRLGRPLRRTWDRWLRDTSTDGLQDSVRARCREEWVDGDTLREDTVEVEVDVYALTDAGADETEELEMSITVHVAKDNATTCTANR